MIHDLFGRGLSLGRSQNPQPLQRYVLQFFWHPVLEIMIIYRKYFFKISIRDE